MEKVHFGVSGRRDREIQSIGALVIDDAHSCIKKPEKRARLRLRQVLMNTEDYVVYS